MTPEHRSWSTSQLRAEGLTRARIGTATRLGYLIRARRGFYVEPTTPDTVVRAVRVGGRLTCLSLLALMGVFVLRNDKVHVHLLRTASRMRSPHSRRVRLESRRTRGVRLHWLPLIGEVPREATCVAVIDALAHAVLCQAPRAAIATIDSALHLGHVTEAGLADVFRALPAKYEVLRALVDGNAESGPETLMRLMLRGLAATCSSRSRSMASDGWISWWTGGSSSSATARSSTSRGTSRSRTAIATSLWQLGAM